MTNQRKRYLSASSADTIVKKRKNILDIDNANADSDLQNENEEDADAESDVNANDTKGRRRFVKAKRDLKMSHKSESNDTGTNKVLKAVMDLQKSVDKRFDEMQEENKSVVKQLQEQISDIRKEFNGRIDSLTKTIETKVTQNVKKCIDDKVKGIRKDIDGELSKVKKQVKDAEKDIINVKETLMPTINERIGDELDELRATVKQIQKDVQEKKGSRTEDVIETKDETRDRNIIIRNFPERENEDVKSRVKNMIRDCLKLRNITVLSAERLASKNNLNPGIVKATLDSQESKQLVMKHKNRLKDSSRYRNSFI